MMDKELINKKKWLDRRRKLHSWSRRAEVVGIAPLHLAVQLKGRD